MFLYVHQLVADGVYLRLGAEQAGYYTVCFDDDFNCRKSLPVLSQNDRKC